MAKLKHNDPCHCGSGRRYRQCHLQADRAAAAVPTRDEALPSSPAAPRPAWVRAVPWVIGIAGGVAAGLVSQQGSKEAGVAVLIATAMAIAAFYIFGNPPAPKGDAKDPAAINFGR